GELGLVEGRSPLLLWQVRHRQPLHERPHLCRAGTTSLLPARPSLSSATDGITSLRHYPRVFLLLILLLLQQLLPLLPLPRACRSPGFVPPPVGCSGGTAAAATVCTRRRPSVVWLPRGGAGGCPSS
ncbi:unnamed protein product, partial [Ectocarpus sp. 13 AM-2016]